MNKRCSHETFLCFDLQRCRSHQVNPVKKQLKLCSDALNTNTLLFVCSLHLIIGFRQSPSASAHTHCLICLVKKPVSASAQPWEAHYTHLFTIRKRFLFRFCLPVTHSKQLVFFRFVTTHRLARRAYYAIFFLCKPLIFLIFYNLAKLSITPLSRLTPAWQGRALYESDRTCASSFWRLTTLNYTCDQLIANNNKNYTTSNK
jgi:hypothetical protein